MVFSKLPHRITRTASPSSCLTSRCDGPSRNWIGEVERAARGMLACGLAPGERVGIWAPNCIEWVLTMFAAARAGLILVNINPAYRRRRNSNSRCGWSAAGRWCLRGDSRAPITRRCSAFADPGAARVVHPGGSSARRIPICCVLIQCGRAIRSAARFRSRDLTGGGHRSRAR